MFLFSFYSRLARRHQLLDLISFIFTSVATSQDLRLSLALLRSQLNFQTQSEITYFNFQCLSIEKFTIVFLLLFIFASYFSTLYYTNLNYFSRIQIVSANYYIKFFIDIFANLQKFIFALTLSLYQGTWLLYFRQFIVQQLQLLFKILSHRTWYFQRILRFFKQEKQCEANKLKSACHNINQNQFQFQRYKSSNIKFDYQIQISIGQMNLNNESLYAQLGKKIEKVIENQRKSFNFVQSLQKNFRKQSECISSQTLTKVVESQIQVIEAKLNDQNCSQLFSKNIGNSSEYLIDQKQSKNLSENEKQKFVAKKQNYENQTSNQFLKYSQETQLNLSSKSVEMFTKKDENYCVFQDIQLNQKLLGNKQDFNVFNQSNCQQDQEYLQIEILNSNPQTDVSQESHQVKMFPHCLNQRNSSSAFNLSNFNSFNQNNTRSDTFDNEQESQFYRRQFVYLVKKIEMINGKKLSQKGIEKISQQLGKIAFGNDNQCDQVQNTLGDKIQLFDSTSKVLNKKNQTIECVPSLHLKPKVLNRKVQQKSMNKPKNPDPIRFETKKQLNKQNLKTVTQTDKQKRKDHGRSISPLSYRVMMQKKKEKILKQQKNFNSSVNDKKFQSKQMNPSKPFVQKNTNYASKSQFQSQVKQKVNTLKIILDLNGEQRTTKTLCFQYSQKDKNLNDQIQDYCAKYNISGKNKKSICDAIQNHKPIVTLKQ